MICANWIDFCLSVPKKIVHSTNKFFLTCPVDRLSQLGQTMYASVKVWMSSVNRLGLKRPFKMYFLAGSMKTVLQLSISPIKWRKSLKKKFFKKFFKAYKWVCALAHRQFFPNSQERFVFVFHDLRIWSVKLGGFLCSYFCSRDFDTRPKSYPL